MPLKIELTNGTEYTFDPIAAAALHVLVGMAMTHDLPQTRGMALPELMIANVRALEKCPGVDEHAAKFLVRCVEDWFGPKGKKGGRLKLVE